LLNGSVKTGHQQEAQYFFKFRLLMAVAASGTDRLLTILNDTPTMTADAPSIV
jgi:hypothetical protein